MIGKYLAKARKKAGYSRSELANLVELDDETIARYERNESEPKISLISKFAEVLNTSVFSLMGEESGRVTSVDIKGSNINGVTAVGGSSNVVHSPSNGEHENPMILVARVLDMIDKDKLKRRDMDVLHSMFKNGLEALEAKKEQVADKTGA